MRLSVQLPTHRVERGAEFASGAAVAEMARCAERAGFDAAFVTDHPFPGDRWLAAGGHHALDPFVALSFAAAATTRLRVQTNILVLAYRNPFLVAKAAATLDVLSGGRLILGVATGYLRSEFEALGADFEARGEVADAALVALRKAWTEAGVVHAGPGWNARGNTMLPRPLQQPHPPLWLGGNSRRAIRRAVELADGWLPFPSPRAAAPHLRTAALESAEELGERLAWAREHARSIGRSAPLEVACMPFSLALDANAPPDAARLAAERDALAALGVTWLLLALPGETRAAWCETVERIGGALRAA